MNNSDLAASVDQSLNLLSKTKVSGTDYTKSIKLNSFTGSFPDTIEIMANNQYVLLEFIPRLSQSASQHYLYYSVVAWLNIQTKDHTIQLRLIPYTSYFHLQTNISYQAGTPLGHLSKAFTFSLTRFSQEVLPAIKNIQIITLQGLQDIFLQKNEMISSIINPKTVTLKLINFGSVSYIDKAQEHEVIIGAFAEYGLKHTRYYKYFYPPNNQTENLKTYNLAREIHKKIESNSTYQAFTPHEKFCRSCHLVEFMELFSP